LALSKTVRRMASGLFNFLYDGKLGELLAPTKSDSQLMVDACTSGNIRQFKELVAKKVDLHTSTQGNSFLHIAAYNGHLAIVQDLLAAGLGINSPGRGKRTALHFAASQGHSKVVEYLVESGADVTLKDAQRKNAYDIASNLALRQYLLTYLFPRTAAPEPSATLQQGAVQTGLSTMMEGQTQLGYSLAEGAIKPDGFVSSANDPTLQKQYGHANVYANTQALTTAPPTGAPPAQTSFLPTSSNKYVSYFGNTSTQGAAPHSAAPHLAPRQAAASYAAAPYAAAPYAAAPYTAPAAAPRVTVPPPVAGHPAMAGQGFSSPHAQSPVQYTSRGFGAPVTMMSSPGVTATIAAPSAPITSDFTGTSVHQQPVSSQFAHAPRFPAASNSYLPPASYLPQH